jgi:hypothetical protein
MTRAEFHASWITFVVIFIAAFALISWAVCK